MSHRLPTARASIGRSPPRLTVWAFLIQAQATDPPNCGSTEEERMAATYLAGPRRHPDHDHPSEEDHGWIDSAPRPP
jgi:hypothetical protein